MPWRTVTPKSVERVIRYRAGSTAGEPCVRSRSEGAAALVTAGRHDGATGARTHPQPETVHTGPAAVVRLESPLALGHGCFSSFDLVLTTSDAMTVMTAEDVATVGKLIHLAGAAPVRSGKEPRAAAVSPRAGDCSRVLTRFAWVKPGPKGSSRSSAQSHPATKTTQVTNFAVAVKKLSAMLQNGWHSERKLLASGNAVPSGTAPEQSEDHKGREPADHPDCVELRHGIHADRPRRVVPTTVHSLWITMWMVCYRRPREFSRGTARGGRRR